MKKLALLGIAVLFAACNGVEKNTYKVVVNVDGLEDGTKAYLQKTSENAPPQTVDTLEIAQGKFEFSGKAEQPELYFITFDGLRGSVPLILEEGNIDVKAYKDSLNASKVGGTTSNNDFAKFIEGTQSISKKINGLREEFNTARQSNDTVAIKTIQETYTEIQEESKAYELNFIKENPNSYISLLILDRMLQTGAQKPEDITPVFESFSPELKAMDKGVKIQKTLEELNKLSIGATAPDFTAPTVEGDSLKLSEVKGKLTMIDFWAAWCKPCREENPNVVALYNDYHEKGFNIIGVSLDRKKEDWIKAIEDDGLTWNHVSNLKFWQDPIAQLYNIKAIPQTYLLDEEGKIIAKNLRGDELRAKVSEILD